MLQCQPFDPLRDRWVAVCRITDARFKGASLRQAAAAAGVHVATVCRWQALSPRFRWMLQEAERFASGVKHQERKPKPHVPWRRDCPLCRFQVEVRTANGKVPFWRCGMWPLCPWASWRPRAPEDCSACGGACFWSHSRKSISCSRCCVRISPP